MAQLHRMLMKVELKISCSGLLGADLYTELHPIVVVRQKDKTGKFHEVGRTERIQNCKDPIFSRAIDLDYQFEEAQTFKFTVYDNHEDRPITDDDDDGLGYVSLTLGQIVAARETTVPLSKQNPSTSVTSAITITTKETTNVNEISFVIHGSGLDKKNFLAKTEPFLQLCRRSGPDKFVVIHQTEAIKDTTKPQWEQFSVVIQNLCRGDFTQPIMFRVFNRENDDTHDLIGEFEASLSELVDVKPPPVRNLVNPKKQSKKKDYKNSGKLTFFECKVLKKSSFLDYIFGGCQLHFACGVDFTGSNGDPRQSSSLHYTGSTNPNEYVRTIQTVGWVLQDYNREKLCTAFGYGAKVPPDNEVSHEFPLNFNEKNPFCAGIEEILAAYYNAIQQVKLWGPTNIAPIINRVANLANEQEQKARKEQNYFILLLITDGVITDVDETREAIVAASNLPMSIIIVGAGNADFIAMDFLDRNKGLLKSANGNRASRHIVQFAAFRNFKMISAAALASSVLVEIPHQVAGYYAMKGIPPAGSQGQANYTAGRPSNNVNS